MHAIVLLYYFYRHILEVKKKNLAVFCFINGIFFPVIFQKLLSRITTQINGITLTVSQAFCFSFLLAPAPIQMKI